MMVNTDWTTRGSHFSLLLAVTIAVFCPAPPTLQAQTPTNSGDESPAAGMTPTLAEVPVDRTLADVLGITMRKASVQYPGTMKLTKIIRVWRDGQLDKKVSARRESGTAREVGTTTLMLGWLEGDKLTPEPHGKLKYFGDGGTAWIDARPEGSSIWGGSVDLQHTGPIEVGKDIPVMELIYGDMPHGYKGLKSDRPLSVRITIHLRLDPLSDSEKNTLHAQPNFHRALPVKE
jgi:hypothetical protein